MKRFWVIFDQDNEAIEVTDKLSIKTKRQLDYLNCDYCEVPFINSKSIKNEYQDLYEDMDGDD